jgi:glucose-1-phosphatase
MIKTLIFDLGNVIVRFDHSRIVQRIEQFCDFSGDDIYNQMFTSDVVRDYDSGKISSAEFFAKVKEKLNLRMSFSEFADAWNSTFDLKPILPKELFKTLAEKYRLLVLSDTNELHFEFIKRNFLLMRHFDDYVLSYKTGTLKPYPEIFQVAVEKANCLPEECFFTDDRAGNIEGAREAGINAVLFETGEKLYEDLQKLNLP